uniref:Uncharacterized protein n=1 Tax=Salix viminalis TaxID=40686 RepID=A0A6N2LB57_SALVM
MLETVVFLLELPVIMLLLLVTILIMIPPAPIWFQEDRSKWLPWNDRTGCGWRKDREAHAEGRQRIPQVQSEEELLA